MWTKQWIPAFNLRRGDKVAEWGLFHDVTYIKGSHRRGVGMTITFVINRHAYEVSINKKLEVLRYV